MPRPTEPSSLEGGDRVVRNRRIRSGFVSAAGARIVNVVVRVLQVPIALDYLGEERYGVWVTLAAFLTMAAFTDLGISNGLVNHLGQAHARNDEQRSSAAVSNALLVTTFLAAVVAALLGVLSLNVSWNDLLNSDDGSVPSVVAVLAVMFVAAMPLTVFKKTLVGLQRTDLMYRADMALWVLSLVALVGAVAVEAPVALVVAILVSPRLVAPLVAFAQVRLHFGWLRVSPRLASRELTGSLLRTGFLFFVLSLSSAVAFQTDFIVLSRILGPETTTLYAVPSQVYMFVPQFATFAFMALWPAYREAAASGDKGWVLEAWRRSTLTVTALHVSTALLLFAASPAIVTIWTNEDLAPSASMRVALGLWIVTLGMSTATHTLLNGLEVIGFQVVTALSMAVANLGISIALVHVVGPPGVAYGSAIAMAAFFLLPQLAYFIVKRDELLERAGRTATAPTLEAPIV